MDMIYDKLFAYLQNLDWNYILTFGVLSFLITKDEAVTYWWRETPNKYKFLMSIRKFVLAIPMGIRIVIVGLVYGMLVFRWRGYDKTHIEVMFQSFVFLVAFYGLILHSIVTKIEKIFGKNEDDKNEDLTGI